MRYTTMLIGALALAVPSEATWLRWPRSLASSNTIPSGFTYYGCYTEATTGRALSTDSYASSSMTVESCAAFCGSKYQFIGVEFGKECYCGQRMSPGSVSAAETECNMKCSGSSSESCGGSSRLNVYQCNTCGTTGSAAYPAATAQGCWTDNFPANAAGTRTLNRTSISLSNMTIDYCDNWCKPYPYFGLEFGAQCYCDFNINTAVGSKSSDSSCTYACRGNLSSQICGGSYLMNIYQHSPVTIMNGNFEEASGSTNVAWTATAVSGATYDFANKGTTSPNLPHGGSQQAVVTQSTSGSSQTTFSQVINVAAGRTYALGVYQRSMSTSNNCTALYALSTTDGKTEIYAVMQSLSSTSWVQTTSSWDSKTYSQFLFAVRVVCSGSTSSARTFYFDDVTFTT